MKIIKYLFVSIILMMIFPIVTNAECNYERLAELSKIAGNVKLSYTYNVVDNKPIFTVNIVNVTNDIYVKDELYENVFTQFENNHTYDFNGETIDYNIYSNDPNCKGELVYKTQLSLPTFNEYSNRTECEKNPKFKFCQKWLNTKEVDVAEFYTKYESYLDDNNNDIKNAEKENTFLNFISNNRLLIIFVIICIIILPFLIFVKRKL